jgi:hypothetical protein
VTALLLRLLLIGMGLSLCFAAVAVAQSPPSVTLNASFSPERLGKSTTVLFGFRVRSPDGGVPSPLTSVNLLLPEGMGLAPTTLGLANCYPTPLLTRGLAGCSPNAQIGSGAATVEVPFGPEILAENVNITAFVGPPVSDNLALLFYAEGNKPIIANLIFSGTLGGFIDTTIPPTPTLPDAADASVVQFHSSIGPAGLTYHVLVDGKSVAYHPTGMVVPVHCPANGFPFSANFTFQDGAHVSATTSTPCPPGHPLKRG